MATSSSGQSGAIGTAQRDQLHRTIWRIADDLRGSVDGWEFKNFVLGMLFYRYISESVTAYINKGEWEAGDPDFDYTALEDAEAESAAGGIIDEKGFFILPSQLFSSIVKRLEQDREGTVENLNTELLAAFRSIEGSAQGTKSEGDFKGLFDDLDVNSARLGSTVLKRNEKLANIILNIAKLDLGRFEDNTIDLFGDAYEYLMQMYASNAGKSGGEFYTPQDVSELLARITVMGKTKVRKVYDPACGSGSLLLKFRKILGPENVKDGYFGQEINLTTYNLARINMFLHDVNFSQFDIAHGDTLVEPAHNEPGQFEAIVSNPPYSTKWAGKNDPVLINDPRYSPAGVLAPPSKAYLAFTMHILYSLATDGTAAIVEFPGVLYRGGAEQKIRQYLVKENKVEAIIQQPPEMYFGTTIATCIIVLKKSKVTNDVVFIDATSEFTRHGKKNWVDGAHTERILEALANRVDVEHFVRVVSNEEIEANDFNLSVSSYVQPENLQDPIDIDQLNLELVEIVEKQFCLRQEIDRIIKEME